MSINFLFKGKVTRNEPEQPTEIYRFGMPFQLNIQQGLAIKFRCLLTVKIQLPAPLDGYIYG